jgi:hypothetical protein
MDDTQSGEEESAFMNKKGCSLINYISDIAMKYRSACIIFDTYSFVLLIINYLPPVFRQSNY